MFARTSNELRLRSQRPSAADAMRRGRYGPAVLVSDLRHFLDLPDDTPAPASRLAEQLRDIVRAATARDEGAGWVSGLPCRRRPGRVRCVGRIRVQRADAQAPIGWECTACGDAGVVSGWQGTLCDLSSGRTVSSGTPQQISVSEDVLAELQQLLLLDEDCERVVFGARAVDEELVLSATDDELEELLGYLAAEANHESDRRRRQRLDAGYDQLSSRPRPAGELTSASRARSPLPRSAPTQVRSGLPDLDVVRVQRWCAERVPEAVRHQVRVECEIAAQHLTIVERRAPWREQAGPEWTTLPVARLRYGKTAKTWTLYWRDRNLRFHLYKPLAPASHVEVLLTEVDRDPTCIFWG